MNRNNIREIENISAILSSENDSDKIKNFIVEMLTDAELETLSKRWRIMEMLLEGRTQRDISKELKVSLCKVTRGAKIIKNKTSITYKFLTKEKKDEQK